MENPYTITKCEHLFCLNCLTDWLDRKRFCPCCRTQVSFDWEENDIKPAPLAIRQLINDLDMTCSTCFKQMKLENFTIHKTACEPKSTPISTHGPLIEQLNTKIACLEGRLAQKTQEANMLMQQKQTLKTEFDSLKQQLENNSMTQSQPIGSQPRDDDMQDEFRIDDHPITETGGASPHTLESILQEIIELRAICESYEEEKEHLEKTILENKSNLNKQRRTIDEHLATIDALKTSNRRHEEQRDQFYEDLLNIQRSKSSLNQEKVALARQLEETKDSKIENDRKLKDQIQQMTWHNDDLAMQIDTLKMEHRQLRSKINRLEEDNERFERQARSRFLD